MSVLHSVVNAKEELLKWIRVTDVKDQFSISIFNSTVTDVNDQEISTEMSFSRPIYPHGLCIILKLDKTVDGNRIQNLVIHLRKFPEENNTTIDSLDLFFKDSTTEMKYTVSPFCTQGGAVQTSKLKVRTIEF